MNEIVPRLLEVEARGGDRLWLRYADGTAGEIDVSDLVGKGVFRTLADRDVFRTVHVGEHGQIVWTTDLEICADAAFLILTGVAAEQAFPGLRQVEADA